MAKNDRQIVAECCKIWNDLKEKHKIVDVLIEAKTRLKEAEDEIDNLELQLREQYQNVDEINETVESTLDHIKWLRNRHFKSEQDTIRYAIDRFRKFEAKLNEYGDPIDISILGMVAKEIKDLEILLDE